jgi:hypothetical protein
MTFPRASGAGSIALTRRSTSPSIHLDKDVLTYLTEKAKAKGIEVSQLINDILRKDIDLVKAVK